MKAARWSSVLCAGVVLVAAVVIPWRAMGTESPVVTWWVPLTLALWGLMLAVGIACTAVRPSRRIGVTILVATVAGAMAFVVLYLWAFSLVGWD